MAKYVNILFFDTLGCFGIETDKTLFLQETICLFHPPQSKKKEISSISKIRIQYPLFGAIN